MNFNATMIGQSITFLVFVWFCMKYVWPPIMAALSRAQGKDCRRPGCCGSWQTRTGTGAEEGG